MEIYGKALARYRGRGRLFLREGTPLPCQVEVAQRSDGVIFVECQARGARTLTIAPERAEAKSVILKSDAARVCVSHLFGPNQYGMRSRRRGAGWTHAMKLLYYANQADVSYGLRTPAASEMRFGLANFEFAGNTSQKKRITGFPDALRTSLPSGELFIEQVDDYQQIVKRLKTIAGVDVTCHATMPLASGASLSDVTRDMEDLCALLSFARGTKINWAYFDILSEAGVKLHTRHVSRVIKPLTSFPAVIDRCEADDLLSLIRCFHRFREAEEPHCLKQVVDHLTDAKLEQPFLEARAMLAVILIDFLVGRYRDRSGRDQIRKDFKRLQTQLRQGLGDLLSSVFSDLADDQRDQVLENLPGLNRTAFWRVLKEFTDSLQLGISESQIHRITAIRNSLVHRASFLDDAENWTQYLQLINLLDRILLGILGYEGHYVDCTRNWRRTEFCRSKPDHEP